MFFNTSRFETNRFSYAFSLGLLSFVLAGIGSILFISDPPIISITADNTIVRFSLLTTYISIVMSLIGYRLLTLEQNKIKQIEYLGQSQAFKDGLRRFIVSMAIAWLLTAICQAVFLLLIDTIWVDSLIPRLLMMLLFVLYGGGLGFGVAYFIVGLDHVEIFWLFVFLAVGGMLFSLTIVQDTNWWQRSVSALGIDVGAGFFFNITIILVGLVALTLARDILDDLKLLTELNRFRLSSYDLIRIGLTGASVGIIGVGLFPTEGLFLSHELHLLSAHVMTLLCVIGMLFLPIIAPDIYPKNFIYLSRASGIICIVIWLADRFHIISFTAMELLLFSIFGIWIGIFSEYTKQYARRQDPVALTAYALDNNIAI